ncbi:MAG: metalloregulator ArsR/SmtB family transcription factor [Longimicrobiales bacterium]
MPTSTAPTPTVILPVFQALADTNRLRILEVLQEGERCVCDLQSALDLGQSLLSHHLAVLREAGLVHARKDGRWVHYSLSDEALAEAEQWIAVTRETARHAEPGRSPC